MKTLGIVFVVIVIVFVAMNVAFMIAKYVFLAIIIFLISLWLRYKFSNKSKTK